NGGVGRVLEALRFRKIVLDALAARFQNRAYAWQRNSRHQKIKRKENERQPQQLRGEGVGIERRKPATVLASGNLDGSYRLCTTLGHCRLHGLCAAVGYRPRVRCLVNRGQTATAAQSAARRCQAAR